MYEKPILSTQSALFLDFDGTLVDLAEEPCSIQVPAFLWQLLNDLNEQLSGSLAIISGRQIEVLDHFLKPLKIATAGVHGLERRCSRGLIHGIQYPKYDFLFKACIKLIEAFPCLFLEQKIMSLALHFRKAPELEKLCIDVFENAIKNKPEFILISGKYVIEVMPSGFSKGTAILDYMKEKPFIGRTPVFIGDDLTDETGFEAVHRCNGISIKVGSGQTNAQHRLNNVAEVHKWLLLNSDFLKMKERK